MMQNFEEQFKNLENEITDLKTNARRNGNYLRTSQKSATFETSINSSEQVVYYTKATLVPAHDNPMLYSVAFETSLDGSQAEAIIDFETDEDSDEYSFFVVARNINPQGRAYSYTVRAIVSATDEFTITTERVYL